MWRQSAFPERSDSDQSISDEEEFERVTYDHGCLESRLRSLDERGKKKDQLQVASQLEILEEDQLHGFVAHEFKFGGKSTSVSLKKLVYSENAAEMHEFQIGEGDFNKYHPRNIFSTGSNDDAISDEAEDKENNVLSNLSNSGVPKYRGSNFHNIENESQHGNCTWTAVLKEADDLVCENAGSTSHAVNFETRKFCQASGSKGKLKFSIRSRSCNESLSRPSMVNDETTKSSEVNKVPRALEAFENRVTKHSMAELLEGLKDENGKQSKAPRVPGESVAMVHRGTEHSASELLEGLQEKKGPSEGTFRRNINMNERRLELPRNRILSSLGNRALDNEDPLETMDCGMSSEDEDTCQNHLTLPTPKVKGQTMADRFQEAFSAAAVDDERALFPINKQTGIGYYGRLQQVMQKEKERHMEFLKQLQTGAAAEDESRSIDVRILSRYLDAKLTVCHCSFDDESKISQCMNSLEKLVDGGEHWKGKIVFTPRICGNVELEVGNLIRIYPPWYKLINPPSLRLISVSRLL